MKYLKNLSSNSFFLILNMKLADVSITLKYKEMYGAMLHVKKVTHTLFLIRKNKRLSLE